MKIEIREKISNANPQKRVEIDIGLVALERVRPSPHFTMTRQDIADVCGCTQQLIENIEKRALMRIRNSALLYTIRREIA